MAFPNGIKIFFDANLFYPIAIFTFLHKIHNYTQIYNIPLYMWISREVYRL